MDYPGSVTTYDSHIERYYCELREGGYVIIKTEVLDKNPILALKSPMPKPSLKPGEVEHFKPEGLICDVLEEDRRGNLFGQLIHISRNVEGFSGMDYISLEEYVAWWLDKGAKVGIRKGNKIVWNDGKEEDIIIKE